MKKKIKIIDILCYISTGDYDKLPKEFEYAGYCWRWCIACKIYETRDEDKNEMNLYKYLAIEGDLNDEVEILDKEDEFEDIEHYDMFDYFGGYDFGGTNKELLGDLQTNFEHINNELDKLIKNQKKIIERLKDE